MGCRDKLFALHRRLLDARQRGPLLGLCRAGLGAAAAGYAVGVRARNRWYERGRLRLHRAPVPVISVGNITAGGTGKTPFVAWLAEYLKGRGHRPAILSRGYGHDPRSGLDDENELLRELVPGVPVIADPNRVRAAAPAVREHDADVLILDDGFQHRRLARDLDIVLIDALAPFGGGRLLPRGLLREPLTELGRADHFVLTRSDLVSNAERRRIEEKLRRHAGEVPVSLAVHEPVGLSPIGGGDGPPLEALEEGTWAAFCGVGNPEGFRGTLERCGADLAVFRAFPDHHRYGRGEIEALLSAAEDAGCEGTVTTQKDALKVARAVAAAGSPLPVVALRAQMAVVEGEGPLRDAISAAVEGPGYGIEGAACTSHTPSKC